MKKIGLLLMILGVFNPLYGDIVKFAEKGKLTKVQECIQKGVDIETKGKNDRTALMWASQEGHLEVVKYLAEKGADVDPVSDNGWTPLMEAVSHGNLEMTKYLVENGADINAKNNDGQTALDLTKNGSVKKYLESLR